jgi:hypothetical protein
MQKRAGELNGMAEMTASASGTIVTILNII